ncbi:hypothetical protein EPK99_23140 [Neorhizobium lilium]|uniref:LysR substrate-binding domain-containing protein n=1 Tax=Neorhizobium lilium TaxID=2503024 RepID=A0A3S3RDK7_9HYPH|nr:LysR substrate-binding domain-containing protein [Neorhizobium lilium]RWX74799.1 hypothetical protein EPK99_23140 [Neorhizobium lilium]
MDIVVDDALINVVRHVFDFDIRVLEMTDASVSAVATGDPVHHVAIASPTYLAEHGTPETPADMTGHRRIQWQRPGTDVPYGWWFQTDDCEVTVDVAGTLTVSHCDVAVAAAADSVGTAFVPEPHARSALAKGAVMPILTSYLPTSPGWSICHLRGIRLSPATQGVLTYLLGANRHE